MASSDRASVKDTLTPTATATPMLSAAAAHANLGRRSSVAITNLSIAQGLSIDPDLLDMDEDESIDGDSDERSSIVRSA
ncbi:hypothetical protein IWW38_004924, partial [Coemansia aciculifera]